MKHCTIFLAACLCWHSAHSRQMALSGRGYEFEGNGKASDATTLPAIYTAVSAHGGWDEALACDRESLREALKNQYRYLFLKDPAQIHEAGNLHIANRQLKKTIDALLKALEDSVPAPSQLQFFQISGEDGRGHVHFTSYFTPIIKVSDKPGEHFKYPLYRKPETWQGQLPAREEIDGRGLLAGRGLELAWSSSLLDNFFMHVQGSGYVEFPDGRRLMLAYDGVNGHAYTSIGRYLVSRGYISSDAISLQSITQWFGQNPDSLQQVLYRNKSYTFFTATDAQPTGASALPLTPGYSIAVDPRYIPLGAVLLGRIPVLNEAGKLERHEYRILTAQDKGGAVKGAGHVDLYAGAGDAARELAGAMHHYGNLWLILAE